MRSRTDLPRSMAIARVLAAIGLIALVTIVSAPPAEAATASELESCFLSKINSARASAGASALTRDGTLAAYGRAHSNKMADNGGLYHSSSAALNPYLPEDWRAWGENVGMASDSSACGSLFQAFMNSSGHRANLLDASFDIAGIGVIIDEDGAMWTTHVFVDVASGGSTTTTSPTTTTSTTSSTTTTSPHLPTTTTTTAPAASSTTSTSTTTTTTTVAPDDSTTTSSTTVAETTSTTSRSTTTTSSEATATTSQDVAPPSAIEAVDGQGTTTTTRAPVDPIDEPLTAALAPVVAGDCTGPLCNDTIALIGLLGLAGVLGGVLAYWALRY